MTSLHQGFQLVGQTIPQRSCNFRGQGSHLPGIFDVVTFTLSDGGFPLRRALNKNYAGLVERDVVFIAPSPSVYIRVEVRRWYERSYLYSLWFSGLDIHLGAAKYISFLRFHSQMILSSPRSKRQIGVHLLSQSQSQNSGLGLRN
jgi:hypothetical protein